ncbi:hypothetical protein [Desulfosporosinus sp. BICA1-9]|uniref:hypothetical protein n=1 Tax=Desulfosporosinus sp. BICA1-9 TaxID=1531958 RepID=UPI00054BDC45|nr:hypothetical protein [Desulfosporosinus sp. BICA1-9]KJS47771.1 MAG: hypothetical protein VR66_17675 [Peptococcaceae bacterium BRH_c23]KJS81739.1 MAG: hypothetical protein JL57_26080 [Desulfosporosinus sp. BICA1-9]HBW35527.1 hypothetical protein [Desulfosporosinus sp.]
MLKTAIAIFKGPQQTKEAIEEIQGESLANSKISVIVRSEYIHQGEFREEIANELAYYPSEINLDKFNAWLVQAPPFVVSDLGEVVVAGPLASQLMHQPQSRGLNEALFSYGLSETRARHYEHEVRTGHWLVLIQTSHEKINSVANALRSFGGRDIEIWNKEIEHPIYPFG